MKSSLHEYLLSKDLRRLIPKKFLWVLQLSIDILWGFSSYFSWFTWCAPVFGFSQYESDIIDWYMCQTSPIRRDLCRRQILRQNFHFLKSVFLKLIPYKLEFRFTNNLVFSPNLLLWTSRMLLSYKQMFTLYQIIEVSGGSVVIYLHIRSYILCTFGYIPRKPIIIP